MSGAGSTEWLVLEKSSTDRLHEIAKSTEATVSMTLLAVYAILLHGYSRHKDLVIGMPVRGRSLPEFEPIMGFFNNLIPLHIGVNADESFAALVSRVKAVVVEGFVYPDVPLEELGRELSTARANSKSGALYQALFSFQDARQRIKKWGNLSHEMLPVFQRGATEDLGIWFVEGQASTQGGITYNADIFHAETIRRMKSALQTIIANVNANPSVSVAGLLSELHTVFPEKTSPTNMPSSTPSASTNANAALRAPSTEMEVLLAGVWCRELKIKSVAVDDNFFDLGGHSLVAMQVMAAMETATGKRVNPQRFIFETLEQIAKGYEEATATVATAEQPGTVKRLFSKLLGGKK
jgi:non-ribosomal peptide synthetase component F